MNLEHASQIVNEGCRIIGLKNEDMHNLERAMEAKYKESSFTAPTEVVQTVSEPILNTNNEVNVEPAMPGTGQPVYNVGQPQVIEPVSQPNIFDQQISSFNEPVQVAASEGIMPELNVLPNEADQIYNAPMYSNNISNLDTPQAFFDRVEEPSQDNIITQEQVESNYNNMNGYSSEDPAILMIDNIKKILGDKNQMINSLNERIKVLEEQLKNEIEARKIAEAQKSAAETTLQAARNSEVSNMQSMQGQPVQNGNGPTLSYQQPNYQQTVY